MLSALPPPQLGSEAGAHEIIFREKAFVNCQAPRRQAEGLVLDFPLCSSLLQAVSRLPSLSAWSPFCTEGRVLHSLGHLLVLPGSVLLNTLHWG